MSDQRPPSPGTFASFVPRVITALLVAGPFVALGLTLGLLWGRAVNATDLVLALILYMVTGHGVTVGFHRLFAHRGFKARRGVKIGLAVVGSMAVEGSVVSWVANHRRHHVHSDRPGDPHSPHPEASGVNGVFRSFVHAHVGWLFRADDTPAERYAPDLLRDPDLVLVGRLFPVLAVASLALPFAVGWALSGGPEGALTAFLWAGLLRMALLHHVTWSVNSICHLVGRRPFVSRDQSRNVAALAVLSFGESWHNLHHAYPTSARHGALPHQIDSSAGVIRLLERLGWVTDVRWPTPERLASLLVAPAATASRPVVAALDMPRATVRSPRPAAAARAR